MFLSGGVARRRAAVHVQAMHTQPPCGTVQVQARADGALLYLVDLPPEALPPVRPRDLAAAWDAARAAALAERWGEARFFRFRRDDGSCTDLALADADATCWASAVDGMVGMSNRYGLSVCLRLLALVDLLARAQWAGKLVALRRDGAAIEPALMQEAATQRLTRDGRFEETGFRRRLAPALLPTAMAMAMLALCVAGCASPSPTAHADAVTAAACRQRADSVLAMRNPQQTYDDDNYATSLRDSPLGTSGMLGVTNQGLSSRYERDKMVQDCINSTGKVAPTPAAPSGDPPS